MTVTLDKTLFIDLETTGVDNSVNMITQIAAEYHVDGMVVAKFYEKLKAVPNPQKSISLGALKITEQNLEDTMTEGEEESKAVIGFIDWLLQLDMKKAHLCGHNVNFDIGFIKTTLKAYNITGWDQVVSYRVEDTCSLARTMMKAGMLKEGSVSLGELANSLGVLIPKGEHLHNAATDVAVTAEVYYRLLNILKESKGALHV